MQDTQRWEELTRKDMMVARLRRVGEPIIFYCSHRCLHRGDGGQGRRAALTARRPATVMQLAWSETKGFALLQHLKHLNQTQMVNYTTVSPW